MSVRKAIRASKSARKTLKAKKPTRKPAARPRRTFVREAMPEVETLTPDQVEERVATEPEPIVASHDAVDHVAKGLAYARDVVAGVVPACVYVKAACARQLNDLERRTTDPEFAKLFRWDENLAGRICRFIELLPHVKGPKASAGELIKLEPWQCFVLTTVFGWRRTDTGGRRFRRVYIEVPRGNAKSTLSSGVGLYCVTSDNEEGAEVYSAATTRDQARIVWGDALAMMKKRPAFATKIGMSVPRSPLATSMHHPRTNSKFEPLSRESTTMDGKNLHVAIVDELHAHKDRGVYDVLETAMAKRFSSMMWVITTAGSDTAGICYEVRSYVVKMLTGVATGEAAESQFGIIYTLDDTDDWTDPANWQKANPNWGVSVMPDAFAQLAHKAMQVLSAQNNFKTKHLNLWVNADVAWMDMRTWDRCTVLDLKIEDFAHKPCVGGLDVATKTDIISDAKLFKTYFPKHTPGKCEVHNEPADFADLVAGREKLCRECYPADGGSEPHYVLFITNYLPESALLDGRNSQYEGWAKEGWLVEMPGEVIDFSLLKSDILRDAAAFDFRELAYDPWQMTQLAQELADNHGLPMVEVRATVQNFSAPMKEMDALVRARRFWHQGSPAMRWMVSNVVCHYDAKDNVYPRKDAPANKIDGVVATVMALGRATVIEDPYTDRGFRQL